MNPLPWLLDWPPRPATVAVTLLLTVFSVGTLVVFGGVVDDIESENVTVESMDLSVRLNDESSIPSGDGSVQTCLGSGTPGDRISVLGDVTVDVPPGWDGPADGSLTVAVSLGHTDEATTQSVPSEGTETVRVFWLLEDDETLSAGDEATVQVSVRTDDATVATATRPVTVEASSRSYDC
ncbi:MULTISPECIES: hypothetical protein [Salinibaculum]|uniref:hypothetical protein n=1 Tax=Salinibaculum TaxID=2732368 RepID=UPI0030D51A69